MAPGKPVGVVKIRVPRHNAQHIGLKLSGEVRAQAEAEGIRTDIYQPNSESANALALAVESASDWNSLLMTARAERGPQWDVGTQQFHVDKYSELYYDPTELQEAAKSQLESENDEEQPQKQQPPPQMHTPHREPPRDFHLSNVHHSMGHQMHDVSPQHHRQMNHHVSQQQHNYPYPNTPMRGSMGPVPSPYPGTPGGPPFNQVQQQYQSQHGLGHDTGSPMRMGMGGMNMGGMDYGQQGHMGGMGMPGGMGGGGMMPPGMNVSPDMRRRVTRGMAEEGYPMH